MIRVAFVQILTFFIVLSLTAQTDSIQAKQLNYRVDWVKSLSSANIKSKSGVSGFLSSVFLGNKTVQPAHPVAVYAPNPNEVLWVDQGINSVFQIKNLNAEVLPSIRKTRPQLSSLIGICYSPELGFLVTDSKENKVLCLSGKKTKALNDSVLLEQPTGIACSKLSGEIYVVETKQHRLTVFSKQGKFLRHVGSRGSGPGEFNFPTHIWIDDKGYLFITDAMNFRIQIFNPTGEFVSSFGQAGDASGYFSRPKGLATDHLGNIYIVDALLNVVQVFNSAGDFLYQFGSQGSNEGQFWLPSGIYIDDLNYIYVADTFNDRIQVFQINHIN